MLRTWPVGPRWDPKNGSLLKLLLLIRSMILVEDPILLSLRIFGSKGGYWSKSANLCLMAQIYNYLINVCDSPPSLFKKEIRYHFQSISPDVTRRWKIWFNKNIQINAEMDSAVSQEGYCPPQFPIAIPSEGVALHFIDLIARFETKVHDMLSIVENPEREIENSNEEGQPTEDGCNETRINMEQNQANPLPATLEPRAIIFSSLFAYVVFSTILYIIHVLALGNSSLQNTALIIFGMMTGGIMNWNYFVDLFLSRCYSIRLILLPITFVLMALIFFILFV